MFSTVFCPCRFITFGSMNANFTLKEKTNKQTNKKKPQKLNGCSKIGLDHGRRMHPLYHMLHVVLVLRLPCAAISVNDALSHQLSSGAPFTNGLTLIPTWIRNYIHYSMWDEITYPFPNFNDGIVEVWEWISNFIPHFPGNVITYPCRD